MIAQVDPNTPLDISDIVHKVNTEYGDPDVMCAHITNGTIPQYYDVVLDKVIYDLTIIPIARQLSDYEAEDTDFDGVVGEFRYIINTLSDVFNKDHTAVKEELIRRMEEYPIDDVRIAYEKRFNNTLN